ncbi:hypothetical protein J3Q64DRAFT_1737237 [Phycomyces blakesleeanus]|uniref:RRM domain-containing protein n=2 Tax=Phycomyces blakesleeanus TaxID=4837 RepID=A0ABR3B1N8_PHYBL
MSPTPDGQLSPQVFDMDGKRILCTADVRGNIALLNKLAKDTNAQYIIHTGDFGFYEQSSLDRISDRTLRHLVQYSTLIPATTRNYLSKLEVPKVRSAFEESYQHLLSQFTDFLAGKQRLEVPVYTVWGACEDVSVLEKFRSGEYSIPNLHILDEANSELLNIGGVSLRLFGLGGACVQHKLFDNGEGTDTIAGGSGTMWTTTLQIGELVETAQEVFDPSEVRVLVTHASPGREGLLAQLALSLRVDFTISAGLHFRYGISYNEFACQPHQDHYRNRLEASKESFMNLWNSIQSQVESSVDVHQKKLLKHALDVVNRLPPDAQYTPSAPGPAGSQPDANLDDQAFKNMWNFNLPDAAYGWTILNIQNGHIGTETHSGGFSFAYRKSPPQQQQQQQQQSLQQQKQQQPHQQAQYVDSPNSTYTPTEATNTEKPHQYPRANEWNSQSPVNAYEGANNGWRESVSSRDDVYNQRETRRPASYTRNPHVAYVGGLSNSTLTDEDIKSYFGRNVVTSVRFPIDTNTQLPKPHCYVDFVDAMALENALQRNGQILRDNRLIVNRPTNYFGDGRGRGRGGPMNSNRNSYRNSGMSLRANDYN